MCDCLVTRTPEERLLRTVSSAIDKELKDTMREMRSTVKLLLLGAGEAGKSTMMKQMKIHHEKGFSPEERESYTPHIHSNLREAMVILTQARQRFEYPLSRPENAPLEVLILPTEPESLEAPVILTEEVLTAIATLEQDSGIQLAFERRKDIQLNDSAEYFMSRLKAVQTPGYIPDQDDVLRVRVRTTGINEYQFSVKTAKFRIVDVGGQRTERRKWIHCFEGVNYIFYVASLSDYHKPLKEDRRVNRMTESLALFRVILKEKTLRNSAVILFLNKLDLFEQEIDAYDLRDYFDDYTGPAHNASAAKEFIVEKYKACNEEPHRSVFHHFTCAVDTEQFQRIFKTVYFDILNMATRDGSAPI
ncbi:Guanine nucleotide-binding protein alpha-1 subunit [Hypsibius exemplaris]|uniref:Guanine nucleotide-binding protein alpha-1 subunit n=1 Tax=Hypsibius exemplaris TaxID=2072580 RepID=A0A1W0X3F8_HYPEX|nr:Guanine nucleotide-binding protein alpha-1 subunit [Hypsibius exemplaris]